MLSERELWNLAIHGSPLTAALALTILDERLGGKISEYAEQILASSDKKSWIK